MLQNNKYNITYVLCGDSGAGFDITDSVLVDRTSSVDPFDKSVPTLEGGLHSWFRRIGRGEAS
jgi:hypothetical protein